MGKYRHQWTARGLLLVISISFLLPPQNVFARTPIVHASAQSNCAIIFNSEGELKTQFDRLFQQEFSKASFPKNLFYRLRKNFLRNDIIQNCLKANGCSEAELTHAVIDSIGSLPFKNARVYAVAVGVFLGSASILGEAIHLLTPQTFTAAFMGTMIGQLNIIIVQIMAPFLEPIISGIRRKAYAWANGKEGLTLSNGRLASMAQNLNSDYSLQEQQGVSRNLQFRGFVSGPLNDALSTSDDAIKINKMTNGLADVARTAYLLFKDLDFVNDRELFPDFTFLQILDLPEPMRETIFRAALKKIQTLDDYKNTENSLEERVNKNEFYRTVMRIWLGLDKAPPLS